MESYIDKQYHCNEEWSSTERKLSIDHVLGPSAIGCVIGIHF